MSKLLPTHVYVKGSSIFIKPTPKWLSAILYVLSNTFNQPKYA